MSNSGLTSELAERLQAVVGDDGWFTDAASVFPYVHEGYGTFSGRSPLVLRPSSTAQVSDIMRLCSNAGVAVVPQGGNTGFIGGAMPDASEQQVVVTLERMRRIRDIDPANYTLTAEAGCILAQLQEAARAAERFFPLSLGAEGSCQIGGNLATNAGGTAVLRYGNARDLTLGLEVVLPDGRVWHGLRRLRKNNTGYDFRHVFIGSEGTLGIITAAVLKLFPQPHATATAMVALTQLSQSVMLLSHLRDCSGDLVTGFEYMRGPIVELVSERIPDCRMPLEGSEHVVLVELAGGVPGQDLEDVLEQALAAAFEQDMIVDAVMASSLAQRHAFWRLRESIPEALEQVGTTVSCDVSVPVAAVPEFVDSAFAMVTARHPDVVIAPYGHVGDGNIHFDLVKQEDAATDVQAELAQLTAITDAVYDIARQFEGSFSAEHGIGQLKVHDMARYLDAVDVDMLRAIKHTFDPHNIMNPGKLVPGVEQ